MAFFSAAGEGSGPATFEGDSAYAGDQPIMLRQVSIAISNWIHASKTLEVLGLAAPTPTGFAEIWVDSLNDNSGPREYDDRIPRRESVRHVPCTDQHARNRRNRHGLSRSA